MRAVRAPLLAGIALALAGCGAAPVLETMTPPSHGARDSSEATPRPVGRKAEWDEKVCLALNQLGEATQDITEMREAAEAGNVDRVGLMAYAAGGFAITAQTALGQAPNWGPSRRALRELTAVTDDLVAGLDLIDIATQEGDEAKLTQGSELVGQAARGLSRVTPDLAQLVRRHDLSCVLPNP